MPPVPPQYRHSMSFAPSSPGASLYDISDEEEGEYHTIKRSKVHKGVKLLYSKSKVCESGAPFRLLSTIAIGPNTVDNAAAY